MNPGFAVLMYGCVGLALCVLRLGQGGQWGDALFSGLFWPLDLSRRLIELVVHALVDTVWEEGRA